MRLKEKALILGSLGLVAALFLAGPPATARSAASAGGPIGPTGIQVIPPVPIPSDNISIRVSGTWSDSCVPQGPAEVTIDDNRITIDLTVPPPGTVCMPVISDWEETASIGHLSPGEYQVTVRTVIDGGLVQVIGQDAFVVGQCGDQNGDGVVDIRDAVIDLQIMTGMLEPALSQRRLSDLKRDGRINVFDAIQGLQVITGLLEMPGRCGPAQIPPGLVAWWPGDGHADDVAGDNHGTLMGGAGFAPGMVGEAFSLDGVDDFVQVQDSATLRPTELTVDAWVNTTEIPDIFRPAFIVARSGPSGTSGYELSVQYTTGGARLDIKLDASTFQTAVGSTNVADGDWHHIAGTYDGSTISVYVDGALERSRTYTGGIGYVAGDPVFIGKWQRISDASHFNGTIDEASIYNRPLTTEEIRDIYEAGSAGKMKP